MKKYRWIFVLLSLLVLFLSSFAVVLSILNRTNGEIYSSGERREYLLYIPEGYKRGEPTPLLISMHGFASWPVQQANISQFNELADEFGFIVVYPQGRGFPLRWQTGAYGEEDPFVDIIFMDDLIRKLMADYSIDPNRMYASGFSNGGGMAHYLACKMSDRITAIATVAGAYALSSEQCNPIRPVPVVTFHGNEDPIVPYVGGTVSAPGYTLPSIGNWVSEWAKRNGCYVEPVEIMDENDVEGLKYSNCDDLVEVHFYTIIAGGHSWPGGRILPEFIVGYTNREINASALIWKFFAQYKLNN